MSEEDAARWLVLAYQFPKGPDARRVKVWRRLQLIGAIAIKNSVYILPDNDQSQEDFAWLLTELESLGAEGAILESKFVDGMTDQQVKALFNAARSADYRELKEQIDSEIEELRSDKSPEPEAFDNLGRVLGRARRRIAEIEAIDFFGADGHDAVEAAMRELTTRVTDRAADEDKETGKMATSQIQDLNGRVWVTRRGVKVDRIASAWLIRQWIDPGAKFKFVSGKGYTPEPDELRFDMFEAEFTHEADLCTFEVLARLIRPDDDALRKVGEIVHDIDLKDGKFGRPETAGIANLLTGIVTGTDDDERRIECGGEMFADLYRYFGAAQA